MRQIEFTSDQVSQNIQQTLQFSDQERTEQLGRFSNLQNTQISVLQKERERLMKKYRTPNHPRIQKIDAKLRITTGLNEEFQAEFEKSNIEVNSFNRTKWRVQGFVLNLQRRGLEGLTVSLFNQEGRWVREIGLASTDERGYFLIDYPSENMEVTVASDQPLFLTITDSDRQILYQAEMPLFLKLGSIDYEEISLDPSQQSQTPPE